MIENFMPYDGLFEPKYVTYYIIVSLLMVFCYFDFSQRPNGIDSIKSQRNVPGNI